jgi:hypothetical protein
MLQWNGSDVDDDLVEFDILFGTGNEPTELLATTTQSSLETDITSGQVYYWRVVSRDEKNNSSQSEIFEFSVE